MHLRMRLAAATAVVTMAALVLYGSTLAMGGVEETKSSAREGETIHFWYSDEALAHFVNSAAASFEEREGVRVIPLLVSGDDYLEAVNQASLHSDSAPDAYVISHDFLEKAYLAGLAEQISDPEGICNREHFPQVALSASSCRGKIVGYPLFFDVSVLVCNKTLLEEWAALNGLPGWEAGIPRTVQDILYLADTFDAPDTLEGILKWDVTDIFYNYWFAGNYMTVGGEEGDDPGQVEILNPEIVRCLTVYQSLNHIFPIEPDQAGYTSVMEEFGRGRLVFAVGSADTVQTLAQIQAREGLSFDYSLARLPWVEEDLKSRSLSVTGVVAVNGYSQHREAANRFASYLAGACAGELYGYSGRPSPKLDAQEGDELMKILKEEYADSVPLPKMIAVGDFWMHLESLFSKIWNGADVETSVRELSDEIQARISAYLSSHGTH